MKVAGSAALMLKSIVVIPRDRPAWTTRAFPAGLSSETNSINWYVVHPGDGIQLKKH
jgi:hypothetical protein